METNILNIEELKPQIIHNDLFETICLITKARNLLCKLKDDEEIIDFDADNHRVLDQIQDNFNNVLGVLWDISKSITAIRLDQFIEIK